jgi:Fe-S-cluster-containing dehydrogenase component
MSAKWSLFVDVTRCNGCRNCHVAVKDEYVGNEEPGYFAAQPNEGQPWLFVEHHERGQVPFTEVTYVTRMCQHCDEAPCIKSARNGAVQKRDDGIVVIDPVRAHGQRQIVDACPYGAISWNEERKLPQAWPFDAHLIDRGWTRTRIEQVCASGALKSAKLEDHELAAKVAAEGWEALEPRRGTKPRVLYRGLDRIRTVFVAGSLEVEKGGVRECLEGARIELIFDGAVIASARSDAFGDFKLGNVAPGGAGVVRILAEGFSSREMAVELTRSISIGRLLLA